MPIITPKKNKTPLGIYVHVPFCKSKCNYCDFYSLPCRTGEALSAYTDAVCRHIKETGPLVPNHVVDTIYFGGGTPSYFGAEGLALILAAIRRSFDVAPDAEITFECNPDSVDDKLLKRLFAEGFNRVSLGIQCDNDEILAKLGRPHNYVDAASAFQKLRKAGFTNISIDLMYGLPGQILNHWIETLHNVMTLGPDHVSCYALKLEPGTPLAQKAHLQQIPGDDTQADMYLATCQILTEMGYRQYEISNFSKRGRYCRHNFKYWTGGEYLGFGPAAASDFGGKRYTMVSDLDAYVEGIRSGGQVLSELIEIPVRERAYEYLMLRLRTNRGISAEEYEGRYLLPFAPLQTLMEENQKHGLAKFENGRWSLTPRGMLVSNPIIRQLHDVQEQTEPFARKRR